MSQSLTLSRAARLVGASRGELQRRIEAGELHSFEGKVALDALLRAYPAVRIQEDPELRRMAEIRAAALYKALPDDSPAEYGRLHHRVAELEAELRDSRARQERYRQILDATTERLAEMQDLCDERQRLMLEALSRWMLHQLRQRT